MAPEKPVATANGADEADLAKAFQELAKGERTATALESQLNSMEAKIEALLAQAEKDQAGVEGLRKLQAEVKDEKSEVKQGSSSEQS